MPQEKMTVDLRHFEPHQRSYTGANGPGDPEKDFPLYLRLQKEGRFPLERLVSRRFRLEQVNEACAALDRGEILGRAIFDL
jgi:S-(hydroxymethyl)glutathione dehydrogenase/alcohol dehydrogenase